MKKFKKNRYLLFVFASWLIAKLKLSFEMSRLAFFRVDRDDEVRFPIRQIREQSVGVWNFEQNRLTMISYDPENQAVVLHRFPVLDRN